MQTTVAILDDHLTVAESLATALRSYSQLHVLGSFTSFTSITELIDAGIIVDVLITDYTMPDINGIDACINLKAISPTTKCILLTMHDASELRYKAQRAGIEGYMLKTASVNDILEQVGSLVRGVNIDYKDHIDDAEINTSSWALSPAEIEIIRCIICKEMSSKEAAAYLYRSQHTVEQHRKNIYHKLGIDGVAALTKYAIEAGICRQNGTHESPITEGAPRP